MKRITSNKGGKEIYGQKWQITESSSDSESDSDLDSVPAESSGTAQISGMDESAKQQSPTVTDPVMKGKREGSHMDEQSMYRAALDDDWLAAEVLLGRDPTLASKPITERGDRALHVAAAMKHKKFVRKLVEHMSRDELELVDSRGHTACCYAATSGVVETARVMIDKSPDLITACYQRKVMPLHEAALRGKMGMVSYLLKSTKTGDLSEEEWFDLLLITIRRDMFDMAIEILERKGSLATMANQGGTPLHLLARQVTYSVSSLRGLYLDSTWAGYLYIMEPPGFNRLAKKLWALMMQQLENDSLLELLKRHHLLHDAAKTGHPKLVKMIAHTYPQLLWETDGNKHTMFHVAVRYRQYDVLNRIPQVGDWINLSAESQDEDGNNILHLAAKLVPRDRVKAPKSTIVLQQELASFKSLEALVSPSCQETRNKAGLTPRELFSKEHKSLFTYSQMWIKNTADSFILISTIFLTVVFGVAFSVPGGYDYETGGPVLMKNSKFQSFLVFEMFAVLSSVISIMMFRSVLSSRFAEDDFRAKLPLQMFFGFMALKFALGLTVIAFMISITLGDDPFMNNFFVTGVVIIFSILPLWDSTEIGAMFHERTKTLRDYT